MIEFSGVPAYKDLMKDTEILIAEQTLKKHQLKLTELRVHLIDIFIKSKNSLTQAQIIEKLTARKISCDRVSIYRNLIQIKKVGLIHEVYENSYIYCSHECSSHPHILLFCDSCQNHEEITDHKKIQTFLTALGQFHFFNKTKPLFLKGVCDSCTA